MLLAMIGCPAMSAVTRMNYRADQNTVALARALAPEPKLLLLDEPFSGLDSEQRLLLAEETKRLITSQQTTALMVSHDQNEAFSMADYVGLLKDGELLQWGLAYDLYHKPISQTVAQFIGMSSMLKGQLAAGRIVETALGRFPLSDTDYPAKPGREVKMLIRPDDIIHDDASPLQAAIISKKFLGAEFLYRLRLHSDETVYCFAPSHHNHRIGEHIGITVDMEHVILFADGDG